jgi:hypothetical protein
MIPTFQWRKSRHAWRWPGYMRGKMVHGSGFKGWLSIYAGPYRFDIWW